LCTHQELADLAAFLVSDQSGYVNGEQIVMDGGEQLKGASEFSHLGDLLTEEQWQMMKPKKKGSDAPISRNSSTSPRKLVVNTSYNPPLLNWEQKVKCSER
jgi:Enoyl-(Acyl carrier protein) reductase